MALTPQQQQALFYSMYGGHNSNLFNQGTSGMSLGDQNTYKNYYGVGGPGYGQFTNWLQANKGARIQEQLGTQPNSIFAPMWQNMLSNSANNYKPTSTATMGSLAQTSPLATQQGTALPTNGSWNVNANYLSGGQNVGNPSTFDPSNPLAGFTMPGGGGPNPNGQGYDYSNPNPGPGQVSIGNAPNAPPPVPMPKTPSANLLTNKTPINPVNNVPPPAPAPQAPGTTINPPGIGTGRLATPKNFSFSPPGWNGNNFNWGR